MENIFKIGVDIDDTVCYLGNTMDQLIMDNFGNDLILKEYSMERRYFFPNGDPVPVDEIFELVTKKLDWDNVPPIMEAVNMLNKLQKRGVEIHFVTHRSEKYTPNVKETTETWLNKYFKNYKIHYSIDKEQTCYDENLSVMVDNDHNVILKIIEHGRKVGRKNSNLPCWGIFYTGALPTTFEEHKYLTRISDWNAVGSIIMLLEIIKNEVKNYK